MNSMHIYQTNDLAEVVEILILSYETGRGRGIIEFEGEELTFDGIGQCGGLMIISPIFHNYVFFINEDWNDDNAMILSVFRGPVVLTDQTIGIKLPKSKYNELIYSLVRE